MSTSDIWSLAISILALVGSVWSTSILFFASPKPSGWKRSAGTGPEGDVEFLGYQITLVNLGKASLFIEAVGWYFQDLERVDQPAGKLMWGNDGSLRENPEVPRTLMPGESLNWYFPANSENDEPIAACYYQRRFRDILLGNGKLTRKFIVIEKIRGGKIRHFAPLN